jgi:hypothetical protein
LEKTNRRASVLQRVAVDGQIRHKLEGIGEGGRKRYLDQVARIHDKTEKRTGKTETLGAIEAS